MDERALLAELRPRILAEARDKLGTQGWAAEDAAQEAWIAVWRALPKRPVDAPLIPWCMGVARHKISNVIREGLAQTRGGPGEAKTLSKRKPVVSVGDLTEVWEGEAACLDVDLAYHYGQIWRAIKMLSPRQREYVFLRFWRGLALPELNEHFGTSNAGASFWNGRAKARSMLAERLAELVGAGAE